MIAMPQSTGATKALLCKQRDPVTCDAAPCWGFVHVLHWRQAYTLRLVSGHETFSHSIQFLTHCQPVVKAASQPLLYCL